MEFYVKVRRAVAGGMSKREAAWYFGVHRDTISKMVSFAEPPEHGRKGLMCSRKLKAFTGVIDRILAHLRRPRDEQSPADGAARGPPSTRGPTRRAGGRTGRTSGTGRPSGVA